MGRTRRGRRLATGEFLADMALKNEFTYSPGRSGL
jgi:hypothetical protein